MEDAKRFSVGRELPDLPRLMSAVSGPANGAVLGFLGIVRERSGEKPVRGLAYSAYVEMAERKLAELGEEIRARFGPLDVAAAHRTGTLAVGEVSFALAVGAPHRAEAFAAAQHFVDRMKQIVPIWKEDLSLKEGD
jgi:molybdopterin synthase catalytic subunit